VRQIMRERSNETYNEMHHITHLGTFVVVAVTKCQLCHKGCRMPGARCNNMVAIGNDASHEIFHSRHTAFADNPVFTQTYALASIEGRGAVIKSRPEQRFGTLSAAASRLLMHTGRRSKFYFAWNQHARSTRSVLDALSRKSQQFTQNSVICIIGIASQSFSSSRCRNQRICCHHLRYVMHAAQVAERGAAQREGLPTSSLTQIHSKAPL
jgi:hypothetical protein